VITAVDGEEGLSLLKTIRPGIIVSSARRRLCPNVIKLRDKLLKINKVMRFVFYGIVNATEVVLLKELGKNEVLSAYVPKSTSLTTLFS
jgi:hypothetical protein